MKKIPSSFMGYKKDVVNEILNKQDNILNTQKKDIEYLKGEINRLEKDLNKNQITTKCCD